MIQVAMEGFKFKFSLWERLENTIDLQGFWQKLYEVCVFVKLKKINYLLNSIIYEVQSLAVNMLRALDLQSLIRKWHISLSCTMHMMFRAKIFHLLNSLKLWVWLMSALKAFIN